jgi:hypothetical protein
MMNNDCVHKSLEEIIETKCYKGNTFAQVKPYGSLIFRRLMLQLTDRMVWQEKHVFSPQTIGYRAL